MNDENPKGSPMKLLVLAHKKEAQSFFDYFSYEKTKEAELFKEKNHYLLISGEGLHKSLYKTSHVLGFLKALDIKINLLINYGVACVLDETKPLDKLYSVRTCYNFQGPQLMNFHSYESVSREGLDCVSSYKRVSDKKTTTYLSHFGSLVDRELWALAWSSHKSQIPFESFKWGFDRGDKDCEDLVLKDPVYSDEFLKHFLNSLKNNPLIDSNSELESDELPLGYYATFSQKQLIQALLKSLKLKNPDFSLKDIKVESSQQNPKKKTQNLIEELKTKLHPEVMTFKKDLEKLNETLLSTGTQVRFSPDFETQEIELRTKISKEKDLENLKKALSLWPYEKIKNKLEAKL